MVAQDVKKIHEINNVNICFKTICSFRRIKLILAYRPIHYDLTYSLWLLEFTLSSPHARDSGAPLDNISPNDQNYAGTNGIPIRFAPMFATGKRELKQHFFEVKEAKVAIKDVTPAEVSTDYPAVTSRPLHQTRLKTLVKNPDQRTNERFN
ncbi:MAG: hypothetical protein ACKVJN_08015 [Woeseiales bacterium]